MKVGRIKEGFFGAGNKNPILLRKTKIKARLHLVIQKQDPTGLHLRGTPRCDVFKPAPLNLCRDSIKSKGAHAGDVGRHLKEVADLEELPISISLPIAFEHVEILFQPDENPLPYISGAKDVGRRQCYAVGAGYVLGRKEESLLQIGLF